MSKENHKFNLKLFLKENIVALRYSLLILILTLGIIIATLIDWGSLFNVGATDSCVADLQSGLGGENIVEGIGSVTINQALTLDAADYASGIVNCSETDIVITNNAVVTIVGNDNGDTDWTNDYGLTWQVSDLTLNSGSTINADGQGYPQGSGPGAGGDALGESSGGGAGYGGAGAEGTTDMTNPAGSRGLSYGDSYNPTNLGSGGGNAGTGGLGGAGGGSLFIIGSGIVDIDGTITANGEESTDVSGSSGGGGSGGTVFIEAHTLTGSGVVRANGGNGYQTSQTGGGGGGGRVAMYCTSENDFTGTVYSEGDDGPVSNGQDGTIAGPTGYPNDPTSLAQYAYEYNEGSSSWGFNSLDVGDSTSSNKIKFEVLASDVDDTDSLAIQVELAEVGTSFTGTPTQTGVSVNYVKTEGDVTASVVIEGLDVSKRYNWRARVKDSYNAVSDWVSYGGNTDVTDTDLIVVGNAVTLTIDSGNNQTGIVNDDLPLPLVVKVTDSNNLPVPFVDVGWNVLTGGGSLSVSSSETNRSGLASVTLTLGSESGTDNNTVNANSSGLVGSPRTFTASASSGDIDHYQIDTPDAALVNEDFEITVTSRDSNNNIVPLTETVDLSAVLSSDIATPGSGTLTPSTASLVDGTVTLTNVSYSVEENIKIKASKDAIVGHSNTVAVVTEYGSCPATLGVVQSSQTWYVNPEGCEGDALCSTTGIFDCSGLDVVVETGVTLTLESYSDGDSIYDDDFGVTILANNFTIEDGATVTADGKGYSAVDVEGDLFGKGPGYNKYGSSYGGQGFGYDLYYVDENENNGYGNVWNPDSLGSSGGAEGVAGGGAVRLIVDNTTTISGTMSSDGLTNTANSGGATGGSIWIDTATITFGTNGFITANGGDGDPRLAYGDYWGGGGSGGRVSIIYDAIGNGGTESTVASKITTYGGTSTNSSIYDFSNYAACGTIYLENTTIDLENEGVLYIKNNNIECKDPFKRTCYRYAVLPENIYDFREINLDDVGHLEISGGSLTVDGDSVIIGDGTSKMIVQGQLAYGGGTTLSVNNVDLGLKGSYSGFTDIQVANTSSGQLSLYADNRSNGGVYYFGDITVNDNGQINFVGYYNDNLNWEDDYGVILNANNVTVSSNGKLNANGLGYSDGIWYDEEGLTYREGFGPGGAYRSGEMDYYGATYGGYGSNFENDSYGNVYLPTDLGSGGFTSGSLTLNVVDYGKVGGFGGGAVKINIADSGSGTLDLSGTISADGESNWTGGSGGSILIDSENIELTTGALISANGGTGVESVTTEYRGSDAGGGRIAIYYDNMTINSVSSDLDIANISNYIQCLGGDIDSDSATSAGPGTIYIEDRSEVSSYGGDLYVDNADRSKEDLFDNNSLLINSNFASLLSGYYNFRSVNLINEGNLHIQGQTSTLNITSSSALVGDNTTPNLISEGYINYSGSETLSINGVNLGVAGDFSGIDDVYIANAGTGGLTLYSDSWAYDPNDSGKKNHFEFGDVIVYEDGFLNIRSYEDEDLVVDSSDDYSVPLYVDNLVINSGGVVSADGLGYGRIQKSEVGSGYEDGVGAVYGGFVENNTVEPYGSIYTPRLLGSQGTDCTGTGTRAGKGGAGGGLLEIYVSDELTLNGEITADGVDGYATDYLGCDWGGGSGGSILLHVQDILGTGIITANGSDSTFDGSGGRIAVYYANDLGFTFNYDHLFATGNTEGPGTIYVENVSSWNSTPEYDGSLVVNNDGIEGLPAGVPTGDYSLQSINVWGYGDVSFLGTGSNLTITTGAGLRGDSTISSINVYGSLNYTGTEDLNIEEVDLGIYGDINGVNNLNVGLTSDSKLTLAANTWAYGETDWYSFDNLHIGGNGEVECVSYVSDDTDWNNDYGVNLQVDNLTIDSGGSLNADGLGYGYQEFYDTDLIGPAGGAYETGSNTVSSGASYGGYGYEYVSYNDDSLDNVHIPYGDVFSPTDIGSKGGSCLYGSSIKRGGNGGGAIRLNVSGVLSLNGTISSNGEDMALESGYSTACYGGAGSGGSLLINTNELSGSGVITANGGDLDQGGSGGRIALYYGSLNGFTIDTSHLQSLGGTNAGPGTVYLENVSYLSDPSYNGDLFVNNSTNDGLSASLVSGQDYSFNSINLSGYGNLEIQGDLGTLTLSGSSSLIGDSTIPMLDVYNTLNYSGNSLVLDGINLSLQGDYTGIDDVIIGNVNDAGLTIYANTSFIDGTTMQYLNDVTVKDGSSLIIDSYSDGDESLSGDYGATLIFDNLTVESGGVVTASGKGYSSDWGGPGQPELDSSIGATYGGHGEGSSAFDTYGDILDPDSLGSKGASCDDIGGRGEVGGIGGGVIDLLINEELALDGIIESNGVDSTYLYASDCTSADSGGGSGGSVNIVTNNLSGSGYIKANGEHCSGGLCGYDGGGGRISISYSNNINFPLTALHLQAYGYEAGAGTVYIRDLNEDYGDLLINNQSSTLTYGSDFIGDDYHFKNVTIGENTILKTIGDVAALRGTVIYVDESFYLSTGSIITGEGLGFPSDSGPGVGGAGDSSGVAGAGGGHGGVGGAGSGGNDSVGTTYGIQQEPVTLGSGGGTSGDGALGGAGGGAIALYSTEGSISVYGEINMDGADGLTSSPGGGGGAGGSILIKAKDIVLGASSDLSAEGGDGGDDAVSDGGGGGGGRIAVLFGNSYVADGSIDTTEGIGFASGQSGTNLGPIGYPMRPENMDQVDVILTESIPIGGTTDSDTVSLEFTASDADTTDVLTPQIEIQKLGVSFTGVPNVIGEDISYLGIPLDVEVSAEGLVLGEAYHWQARVKDSTGVYSEWESFGDNEETDADFVITEASKLVLSSSVATINAGGYLSLNVSARDNSDYVDTLFRETINFSSTDSKSVLPNNYTFISDDFGIHDFTNGVQLKTVGEQQITVNCVTNPNITSDSVTVNVLNAPGQLNTSINLNPSQIESDGEDSSEVTITLTDDYENPIIGKIVEINATGSGNTIIQPVEATNEDGMAIGYITSTVIEDKVVSVTVDGEVQDETAVLEVGDFTAPVITDITVSEITETSAKITWTTDEPTTGQVEYGTSYNYGSTTNYDNDLTSIHSVTLTNLQGATEYYFRVLVRDATLNETLSSNRTFTTLGDQSLNIRYITVSNVSTSSGLINWGTSIPSSALLEYGLSASLGNRVEISDISSENSYSLSGLSKDTTYYFKLTFYSGELVEESQVRSFRTLSDENAVQIIDIKVENVTSDSADIIFSTTKDSQITLNYGETISYSETIEVTEYQTTHRFELTNLKSSTDYHFEITAKDNDGYETKSSDQTFRTLDDESPDCGIFDIYNEQIDTVLNISWKTACDMTCHIEYGETTDYGFETGGVTRQSDLDYFTSLDVLNFQNKDLHYRVVCDLDGEEITSLDQYYLVLESLPTTGDEPTIMESVASYVIPSFTGLGILLQLLNLLAKLGQLPKLGELIGAIFDKEKKKQGWGIVYDLDKNAPIPFAIVRLYKVPTGEIVDEVVTDLEGRYRFLSDNGRFTIGVEHPDFVIPDTKSKLASRYDLTNKYLGGEIEVKDKLAVSYDIPLLSKSLAEKDNYYQSLKDDFKVFMDKIGVWLNIVGGTLMILALIFSPTIVNFILFGLNLGVIALIWYLGTLHPKNWGYVVVKPTGEKVNGVFVRLFDTKENKLINTQITDENGRYGFLADEGKYAIWVESPFYEQLEKLEFEVKKKERILKKNISVKKVQGVDEDVKKFQTPFGK